ncbi:MAG: hypothetical protein JW791_04855 [Nanoarchaeota archaeon]|nr:hypothetical protein [Nanoarchaeota archaeon]
MNEALRQKVINAIDYLGKSFYINQDNTRLHYKMGGEDKKMRTPDVSLMSVLTYLSNGKQLITGTYGAGKTTISEAISSIFNSIPLEIVSEGLLRCNPQLTEEKMIGRPDLGMLQQGIEKVVWSYFTLMPTNLIDEFNRMGADKQILLLDSIDRGNFKYLNDMIKKNGATYATKNEIDGGNTELLPPILDRFSVEVEVVPAVGYTKLINGEKKILSNKEIAEKIMETNEAKNSLEKIMKENETKIMKEEINKSMEKGNNFDKEDVRKLNEMKSSFKENLSTLNEVYEEDILSLQNEFQEKTKGLTFNGNEKEEMFEDIKKIHFDEDAAQFLEYVFAEANFDPENGYKGQPINTQKNHSINYLMAKLKEDSSLSMRWINSMINYSKSLSWLKGEEKVTLETIKYVLPYTLMNKLKSTVDNDRKPLETNKTSYAKKVSKEICDRFLDDSKYLPGFSSLIGKIHECIAQGDDKNTRKALNAIRDWSESEHPIFEFFKKSAEKEVDGEYYNA